MTSVGSLVIVQSAVKGGREGYRHVTWQPRHKGAAAGRGLRSGRRKGRGQAQQS